MDFSAGDVVIGGAHGYAEHINSEGVHQQHIELRDDDNNLMKVWGATFTPSGDAHFAVGQITTYEDYTPHDICYIPGTDPPEFAVLIGRLADAVELWHVDENHAVLATYTGLNTDTGWVHTTPLKLAVACDGDTVYYTDQGASIFRYSLTTGQLAVFDVSADPNYIFGGIDIDADGDIYVALTTTGVGPRRDVALGSTTELWTDQVGETPISVYKRLISDGSEVLSHEVSLDLANINDEVLSLAAYYYPCVVNPFVFYHIRGA